MLRYRPHRCSRSAADMMRDGVGAVGGAWPPNIPKLKPPPLPFVATGEGLEKTEAPEAAPAAAAGCAAAAMNMLCSRPGIAAGATGPGVRRRRLMRWGWGPSGTGPLRRG